MNRLYILNLNPIQITLPCVAPINIFAPILIAQRTHFNSFDLKLLAVWCLLSSQARIIQYQLLTSTKTPRSQRVLMPSPQKMWPLSLEWREVSGASQHACKYYNNRLQKPCLYNEGS